METLCKHKFPSEAVLVKANKEMWTRPLCPEEEALVKEAVAKRQKEFRAGRHAAHQALEQLNAPWEPLLFGDKRQPLWPAGYLGSITHCQGACVAVCAKRNNIISLGIDVEPLKPLPKGTAQYIHTSEDKTLIQQHNTLPERLIFSAKESLYKCYFPLVEQFFGFQAVSLSIDTNEQTFRFTPTPHCPIDFPEQFLFHGHYFTEGDHLYTGCYLKTQNSQCAA
jgi:4'-phosphopantetheinyl transferase EntD